MNISMQEMYDIAIALITDKNSEVNGANYGTAATYNIKRSPFSMTIYAPHQLPDQNITEPQWSFYTGYIGLYKNNELLLDSYTKHTISHAFKKSKYNPRRIFSRMREPYFFKIIDTARARMFNTAQTSENSSKLRECINRTMFQNQK